MSDLTGTITFFHDPAPPALPPLPEKVLLVCRVDPLGLWYQPSGNPNLSVEENAANLTESGYATRIITIQPPPPSREASDAEVCEIIRAVMTEWKATDNEGILESLPRTVEAVRAALTKGNAHATK